MSTPRLAPLVLLDVNETLLDLTGLDPLFTEAFGSAEWRVAWFQATLALAMKNTDEGQCQTFPLTGRQALAALVQGQGREVPQDFAEKLTAAMQTLPLHPDVPEGIRLLKEQEFPGGLQKCAEQQPR